MLRIPVGDQEILIPQIFFENEEMSSNRRLPSVWPRRHSCYDGLTDVLGDPFQRP